MRRLLLVVALVLAAVLLYLAPAVPMLARFGALPHNPGRPMTVLLAGVTPKYSGYHTKAPEDYRGPTDTLMVAQFRPGDHQVRILNIPRDTWMNVPKWGWGKINGANVHGGPDMMVAAVQQLTDLQLDGYVLINLTALRDVVGSLGGITVDVPEAMHYQDTAAGLDINLLPGKQTLNGVQAEGFMRFRHDGLGDIGRVGRQQAFMSALSKKVQSPWGILHLPNALGAAYRDTRSNLTKAQSGQLLYTLVRRPQLTTTLLPGSFGTGGTWTPDSAAIADLVRHSFNDGDPRQLSIALVNIDAPNGSATRLRTHLQALGYRNVWITSETRHSATTEIRASDIPGVAERLRQDVGFGQVMSGDVGVPGADLTVRLGSDTPSTQ